MVTSLVLVRHGQSTWNAQRRWQGQADPPLSELGHDQARAAATSLRNLVPTIDVAVSSPQVRAAVTADILVAGAYPHIRVEDIERLSDLRERSAGPWSGLTRDDIEEQYPSYLADDRRPEGYESDESLFTRVEQTLLGLAKRHPGTIILAVCHGGVINTLASELGAASGRMPNLSGYRVTATAETLTMGERFDLLDPAAQTGGDARRV